MAKKKKDEGCAKPMTYKPPTSAQERKFAAEHAARVAVREDPVIKKMIKEKEDEITKQVLRVISQKLD